MSPDQWELLRDLTIVIATYERPLELERAIEYWRDTPITIHIVDGSDSPWFPIGALPGVSTIIYHHEPQNVGETLRSNYIRRMQLAAILSKTKYSALCGEDDGFTLTGLAACIETLNNDSAIGAIIGHTVGFEKSGGELLWWLRNAEVRNAESLRSESVTDRLSNFGILGSPILYYGMFRTTSWKTILQLTFEYDFRLKPMLQENLFHSVGHALCRSVVIERIVWLRRAYVERINFESTPIERDWIENELRDKKNSVEVKKYYGQLSRAVALSLPSGQIHKADKISKKTLAPRIWSSELSQIRKLRRTIARRLVSFGSVMSPMLRLKINRLLPIRISSGLGFIEINPSVKFASKKRPIDEFISSLAKTDVTFDADELHIWERLQLKPREELRLHANI